MFRVICCYLETSGSSFFGAKIMETTNENRFDRKQAADYLGVSLVTLDRAISNKKISFFRIGRRIVFDLRHLEEFLTKNEVSAKQ